MASASDDHTVRLWDLATRSATKELLGNGSLVMRVVFTPDGTRVAYTNRDRVSGEWDTWTVPVLGR